MIKSYADMMERVAAGAPVRVAVAGEADGEVLAALDAARGLAEPVLVGDEGAIAALLPAGLAGARVVHAADEAAAAHTAAALVAAGEAGVLMKGSLNTSVFLRGALAHLRAGGLLSHLAAFELPGAEKLVFHTDGGMNVAPGLEDKRRILDNAVAALGRLGYGTINVALLAANERVDEKMPATVDAAALAGQAANFPGCVLEGPVALDVAVSPSAAAHKGIQSHVSGRVDLFLMPNIETGNALGKALIYYGGARMAGVVLGAARPIVLTSRAEDAAGKLHSLALACLLGRDG